MKRHDVECSKPRVGARRDIESLASPQDHIRLERRNHLGKSTIVEICQIDSAKSYCKSMTGQPPTVEAYIIKVKPAKCSTLVKQLARDLPLAVKSKHEGYNDNPRNNQQVNIDLSHLKRVRRTSQSAAVVSDVIGTESPEQHIEPPSKKQKVSVDLNILVGAVSVIDQMLSDSDSNMFLLQLIESHGPLETLLVPSRPPLSKDEWQEWNNRWWPTSYSPLSWEEHREQQLALGTEEMQQMERFMKYLEHERTYSDATVEAKVSSQKEISDCTQNDTERDRTGPFCDIKPSSIPRAAMVIDPKLDKVVASSWHEQQAQEQQFHQCLRLHDSTMMSINDSPSHAPSLYPTFGSHNPLATPIMLALQGVSRLERSEVLSAVANDVDAEYSTNNCTGTPHSVSENSNLDTCKTAGRRHQHYLCTGFDLYASYEPSVMEAMACVHSRLRRLIFLSSSSCATTGRTDNETSRCWRPAFENGCSVHFVHCLPGTNHKYRVFHFLREAGDGRKGLPDVD